MTKTTAGTGENAKTAGKGPENTSKTDETPDNDPATMFARNMEKLERFSQAMMKASIGAQDVLSTAIGQKNESETCDNPDPFDLAPGYAQVFGALAANPERAIAAQTSLWEGYAKIWTAAAKKAAGEPADPVITPDTGDRRWRAPEWSQNQAFALMQQSYLHTANWLNEIISAAPDIDPQTRAKLRFFTKQMTDAFAPTNFAMTNPDVIRQTMQTGGENLTKGLENFTRDMARGHGKLKISQTDTEAYEVGVDVATSPGKVVFENALFQLIQYAPATDETYSRPLLIFPPWINKFYILDLRPQTSMIRWLVSKGYTVFLVSWVNPDTALKDKTFEDYMRDGVFAALEAVISATGVKSVNTVGYCIGGTLLAASLAFMAQKGDKRIASATFFAAQTDFEKAGDLRVFCDDAGLAEIERRMDAAGGVLEGAAMAETFNMLRANDLIWSNVINNYLLGRSPRAFDLLFWNADTTRMPKALHLFYLDTFYRRNAFAKGALTLGGITLDPARIGIPLYVQASREDHIAPWHSVYRGARLMAGAQNKNVRFTLAGSGHIAGVINPPAAKKYQYWTNTALPTSADEWRAGAVEHPGSWWPDWHKWLARKSGKKIPARTPGDGKLDIIEDAPGRYVRVKS